MKVIIHFKSDNGFLPYATYQSPAFNLCVQYGPTLKPIYIGGINPIFPLPDKISTDLTIDKLFDLFSFKSVRMEFVPPHDLYLTVPGYKEEWIQWNP